MANKQEVSSESAKTVREETHETVGDPEHVVRTYPSGRVRSLSEQIAMDAVPPSYGCIGNGLYVRMGDGKKKWKR
jgi:hypothetical protein